jgi:hypothetical protein
MKRRGVFLLGAKEREGKDLSDDGSEWWVFNGALMKHGTTDTRLIVAIEATVTGSDEKQAGVG